MDFKYSHLFILNINMEMKRMSTEENSKLKHYVLWDTTLNT